MTTIAVCLRMPAKTAHLPGPRHNSFQALLSDVQANFFAAIVKTNQGRAATMWRKSIWVIAGLLCSASSSALESTMRDQKSLYTYKFWLTNCKNADGTDAQPPGCSSNTGNTRHRKRSPQTYGLVSPARMTMPITQSGVAFKEGINRKIISVLADSERQTIIQLQDDMVCTVWASNPYESPSPFENPAILESFLKVYFDTETAPIITYQQTIRGAPHPTLRFGTSDISGAYIRDAGAAIWAACRIKGHQLDDPKMRELTALIAGSTRQY